MQEQYEDKIIMADTFIKQYGMKRSGTNFTKVFIENNFPGTCVVANILGWKHGYFYPNKDPLGGNWLGDHNKQNAEVMNKSNDDIVKAVFAQYDSGNMLYVVSVRNPYVWFAAVLRYIPGLRADVKTVLKYMGAWSTMHRHWLMALPSNKTYFCIYEKLLDNPSATKQEVADRFGLEGTKELNIEKKNVAPGAQFNTYFKKRTGCFSVFTQRLLNIANSALDPDLMAGFGYTFVRNIPISK